MSEVSFFPGASAISAFRRDRIRLALEGADCAVKDLSCSWAYLVHCAPSVLAAPLCSKDPVTSSVFENLSPLLQLQGASFPPLGRDSLRLWVFPRHGTLSPWASKAIDIAQRCGLTSLNRLERGRCFEFQFGKGALSRAVEAVQAFIQSQKGQSFFYDQMTEEVFFNSPPVHLIEQPPRKAA